MEVLLVSHLDCCVWQQVPYNYGIKTTYPLTIVAHSPSLGSLIVQDGYIESKNTNCYKMRILAVNDRPQLLVLEIVYLYR